MGAMQDVRLCDQNGPFGSKILGSIRLENTAELRFVLLQFR